jgi:hypothetical protein
VKILVVHHSKSTKSEKVYLSDDYLLANRELFGAQELDTWGGIRLLAKSHEVWRLEISPNEGVARLVDNYGEQRLIKPITTGFIVNDVGYVQALFKYLDPSLAQFAHSCLRELAAKIQLDFTFELWWSDTQFYHPLIPNRVKRVVRSVNFEPSHVLAEDASIFRFIRALLKIYSERQVARNATIVPISPLDRRRYKRIGIKAEKILPLRQLPFILDLKLESISQPKTFVMTGSTFDVRHNRRNLEFVINKIAPAIQKLNPSLKIQIFGNRIPDLVKKPANLILSGFDPNLQKKMLGAAGVIVPYHGGAGMQSKIFEPLSLGVCVLANPKSLVGFPFEPKVHFQPAESVQEYVQGMTNLIDNPELERNMKLRSVSLCKELFNKALICQSTENILYHAHS